MFTGLKWWKWLVLLIVPYVILMGFLVPLGQGIIKVTPATLRANQANTITVTGYNTQFLKSKNTTAWLRVNDQLVGSTNTLSISDQVAEFQFYIPYNSEVKSEYIDLSLIVNTEQGPLVLPSAFSFKNEKDSNTAIQNGWTREAPVFKAESNFNYPYRNLMAETIRHTFFHVPLWFAMTFLFMASVFYSIRHLRKSNTSDDNKVVALVGTGVLFGILGTITGMFWAKFTWGSYWSFDVKQNMTAIALLIYAGFFLLRKTIADPDSKGRIGNIYNIFAFCMLIPLIFIIPRRYDSLHPGNGGNPAMGGEDLDNTMRVVFYPAVIAYICLGFWLSELYYRYKILKSKIDDHA